MNSFRCVDVVWCCCGLSWGYRKEEYVVRSRPARINGCTRVQALLRKAFRHHMKKMESLKTAQRAEVKTCFAKHEWNKELCVWMSIFYTPFDIILPTYQESMSVWRFLFMRQLVYKTRLAQRQKSFITKTWIEQHFKYTHSVTLTCKHSVARWIYC